MIDYNKILKRNNPGFIGPYSVENCISNNKTHFAKMYPDVNFDEKYILWLQCETYYEYLSDSIKGTILFDTENNEDLISLDNLVRTRHIHPNRLYSTICLKNGRKLSDIGVVIPFGSFRDLSAVKRIVIHWQIEGLDSVGTCHNICSIYNVSFKYVEGKKVYSIKTCDCCNIIDWLIEHGEEFFDESKDLRSIDRHILDKKLESYDKARLLIPDCQKTGAYFNKFFKGELLTDEEFDFARLSPFATPEQSVEVYVTNEEDIYPLEYSLLAY